MGGLGMGGVGHGGAEDGAVDLIAWDVWQTMMDELRSVVEWLGSILMRLPITSYYFLSLHITSCCFLSLLVSPASVLTL